MDSSKFLFLSKTLYNINFKFNKHFFFQSFKNSFRSSEKWGPKNSKIRREWMAFKEEAKKNRESFGNSKFKHILYSLNGTYRRNIKQV